MNDRAAGGCGHRQCADRCRNIPTGDGVERALSSRVSEVVTERRKSDRRVIGALDRRRPAGHAQDLYTRIEEKRRAMEADRRRHSRRQSEAYEIVGYAGQSSVTDVLS